MKYIYERGKLNRKMHIQKVTTSGEMLMKAICDIDLNFNSTINAPFTLGRGVCKKCKRKAQWH